MIIDKEAIQQFDDRYRARLINSLSGYKSANLIGTIDQTGQTNLAIVSSVFHIGANPPLIGVIFRPHSVARHTLENILSTQNFTVNHVNKEIYQQAHQTSARYEKFESEFEKVGLSPWFVSDIDAPFVKESRLKFSVILKQHIPLEINGTELIIGEINKIIVEQKAVQFDGYIDIESLDTVAISGLDSYHQTNRLSRLSYAKPQKKISSLNVDGSQT